MRARCRSSKPSVPARVRARLGFSARLASMAGLVAWAMVFPTSSHAQPALESAVLTDRGFVSRSEARSSFEEVQGAEAGPVQFLLDASYSLEFNDNVNTSENSPEGDLIQTPSVNLAIAAPVSERSDLAFQIGVGYRAYWHNQDLSRLRITPGSEVAYDLEVKNVSVILFDRVSYTEDVATAPDLANQTQFPRFENTVGGQLGWTAGDFLVTGGYGFQIYRSTSDEFSYVNRSSHLPFLRTGYVFARGAAQSGLEFSATLTDYQDSTNSDTAIVSFGPYLDWTVTDVLHTELRGGFAYAANSLTILPDETFDASSFYLGLDVTHALTDYISYQLMVTHQVRPSFEQGAAFTEETVCRYQLTWAIHDAMSLGLGLRYMHGEQSVAAGVDPSEIYDQWRVRLRLSYALTAKLSSDWTYALVLRDSNLDGRSYTQNQVSLGLSYQFE